MDVRFRILGPVELTIGQDVVSVPPGRQQIILGALLLGANRVVSTDFLIDAVWEQRPPSTARSQVQICISALRQAFRSRGLPSPIATRAGGYVLTVADGGLDVQVFEGLVGRADAAERAGRLEDAVELLRQAQALWRGPVLGGDVSAALRSGAVRLEEERLQALENRIDLELRLGRRHRLVGDMTGLVEQYPLRERLRGLLMLALYRSGRSAEALDVYRAGRATTIAELGIEPGEDLNRLHLGILARDDALQADDERPAAPAPQPVTEPHLLPADTSDFAGREELIEQAEDVLLPGAGQGQAVRILVVTGKAGVGKTTLAMHVSHRLAEHFVDGQLYCNFAGMSGSALDPVDVLGRFLRALGLPRSSVPDDVDERAEMYRSRLGGRRILVVLDDVTAESQVTPLLPGSESCAVIVTCRTRLTGISGARLLDVDVLEPGPAVRLLASVIGGDRVHREPAAAEALVKLVGGLPLALRIVAARLAARSYWSLASMLGRLADERHRLDELAYGDMEVRASLLLTYEGLDPRPARLFRLLSLAAGDGVPAWAGAAMLDVDVEQATDALEVLVDSQLLEVVGMDPAGRPRYGFHDIIRVFAKERLAEQETPDVRAEALHRMLGGWLAFVDQAHRKVYGGEFTVLRGNARRWPLPGDVVLDDPLLWLEMERINLCRAVGQAADAGLHELCWELAVRSVTLFEAHSYFDEWQQTHDRALEAVRRAGNRRGEAALTCSLGSLHLTRHRLGRARSVLQPALRLFSELGDDHGLALTRRNLALVDYNQGDRERSADEYRLALEGFRRVGDLVGEAHVLSQVARIELDAGGYGHAIEELNRALAICREVGGQRVETQVLYWLGEAMFRQRRYEQAELLTGVVLDMVRRNGDAVGESHALHTLGLIKGRAGDREQAEKLLRAAIDVCEQIADPVGAAAVTLDLAALLGEHEEYSRAVTLAEQALRVFVDRGAPALEARARDVFESLTDTRGTLDTE
ncbi:BTAD domain-containing putative transcriptional regulator [Amycolatopsis sp. NPDC003861]